MRAVLFMDKHMLNNFKAINAMFHALDLCKAINFLFVTKLLLLFVAAIHATGTENWTVSSQLETTNLQLVCPTHANTLARLLHSLGAGKGDVHIMESSVRQ